MSRVIVQLISVLITKVRFHCNSNNVKKDELSIKVKYHCCVYFIKYILRIDGNRYQITILFSSIDYFVALKTLLFIFTF